MLIGNKCDEEIKISPEKISELINGTQDYQLEYIQCSAKTGENVAQIFRRSLELGYYASRFRWEKIKILLFVYKFAMRDETNAKFSWGNICEAIPSMIKKKRNSTIILNVLPPEIMKKLISFI